MAKFKVDQVVRLKLRPAVKVHIVGGEQDGYVGRMYEKDIVGKEYSKFREFELEEILKERDSETENF